MFRRVCIALATVALSVSLWGCVRDTTYDDRPYGLRGDMYERDQSYGEGVHEQRLRARGQQWPSDDRTGEGTYRTP